MKEIKITEIKGIKIGHGQDEAGGTGCTVIICEDGAAAGVDVRGSAPATRETDLLRSVSIVEKIHAVMISGGSAYGLDACAGAMEYLEEKGIGFNTDVAVVPIVCGASLFDLAVGDPGSRPDKAMGYKACKAAGTVEPQEGNAGAGTGASVGKYFGPERSMKGGIGIHAVRIENVECAAIVVVNAIGDVFDPVTGKQIAGPLSEDKSQMLNTVSIMYEEIATGRNIFTGNTTIGCVITNAKLTKPQCNKLAAVAQNGLAAAVRPVHTNSDGDAIFVLSTGEVEADSDGLGVLAAEVVSMAAVRGVNKAKSAYGLKAAEDFL